MESLEHLADVFTKTTATSVTTGAIPNVASYPRVKMYAPGPRYPTHPTRLHNSTTPVPALVVEYPKANEYKTLESS